MASKRKQRQRQAAAASRPRQHQAPRPGQQARPAARPARKPVSRTPGWVLPTAVVAVLAVIVGVFFLVRFYLTPPAPANLTPNGTQTVVTAITTLPASEFDSVGLGTATNNMKAISGTPATGPGGKPLVFYEGAEYCPYCAAERWPVIIALSRFGTWSGLATDSSSATDVYPNTPTFTFRNASYTSLYIEFQSVETSDRNQNPLQTPTVAQQKLIDKYSPGSIPFVDLGNRYMFSGSAYLPDKVAGMSWQAVADTLQDPGSPQSKAIVGGANLVTAAVCKLTGDQPAAVCDSTIQSIEAKLG